MNYNYLSITTSKTHPVSYKTPLKNSSQDCTIEESIDLILNHQVNSLDDANLEIDHWLQRKWGVCLDYYLLSQGQGNPINHPPSSLPSNIDILLPCEKIEEHISPIEALLSRKTHRKFQDKPLRLQIFSQLLQELKRELFSDIWCYYLVVFNVESIPPGIYRYNSQEHGLITVKGGMFRNDVVKLLCGMSASLSASFLLLLSVDVNQAQTCYPYDRALREIYIDSGRLMQKVLIKGMQYKVGGLPSPAMRDTAMCNFLNIDPNDCIPLYSLTMGLIPKGTAQ
ncbi:MAG: hypothetical protein S4CHLAM81_13880 [Chlamydiales bacterium]|nr:hypothetical protein [Chlamydiales bacterium]MCH9636160.1 hypothetical protein [Chlamydiales bacterium]